MPTINIDSIINGTDEKRLLNLYREIKANYNESSAEEFFNFYKEKPLSFIIENSRYIFSEPYYGYKFYTEAVTNEGYCHFASMEKELDKVSSYYEDNKDQFGDKQKEMYESLINNLNNMVDRNKHVRVVTEALEELYPGLEYGIADRLYAEDTSLEEYLMNTGGEGLYQAVVEAYLPYIATATSVDYAVMLAESFNDTLSNENNVTESDDTFANAAMRTVVGNKAKLDNAYMENVNALPFDIRVSLIATAESNLSDMLDKIATVNEEIIQYESANDAINAVFEDFHENTIFKDVYDKEKATMDKYRAIVAEATSIVLEHDSSETFDISGYTYLSKSNSYEDAIVEAAEDWDFFVEAEALFLEEAKETLRNRDKTEGYMNDGAEKSNDSPQYSNTITNYDKAPKAPEKKDLATRIQNKAMDSQVKQMKLFGKIKQTATAVGNAGKAVVTLPLNIVNSIKEIGKKFDEADDERRKRYITEPGFRKKIFRNMKLALMYSTATSISLASLPVLWAARHASKEKNRRMREECYRELETEISICEEKINDANAAGDNKEKYRLMRIRDKLKAEALRVRTNSRYI